MASIMNTLTRLRDGTNQMESLRNDGESTKELADNVREVLNTVTQETRYVLVQNILAHPKKAPSLKELDFVNPSKSKSTIRNHLDKLVEIGIVEEIKLPDEARKRDLPWKFYYLTEEAREFLEEHDLVRAEDTLQEMHEKLEKPDEIRKYEEAPRPSEFEDGEKQAKKKLAP